MAAYCFMQTILIDFLIDFKYSRDDVYCDTNRTQITAESGCLVGMGHSVCIILDTAIVTFLICCLLARWLLPMSKRMDREAIFNQISRFMSTAADIIDIADYFGREGIADSYSLTKGVEIVFSISVTQFVFSMQATKARNVKLTSGVRKFVDILFATEAWSLILSLVTQEIPCLVVRIIIIFTIDTLKQFAVYFFALKNLLMIILLVYRIIQVTHRVYAKEKNVLLK
jgi:hypothetical protein